MCRISAQGSDANCRGLLFGLWFSPGAGFDLRVQGRAHLTIFNLILTHPTQRRKANLLHHPLACMVTINKALDDQSFGLRISRDEGHPHLHS